MPELTFDEEWILSARIMASEARRPMRRASLEDLVIEVNGETRRPGIPLMIVAAMLRLA
ncbi:MAG: hypothetical protein NEA02_10630 [Thermoanaerobaculia bacterium]|nr:hypothetical protein [Thermoanaerobaculia bacterium]